MMWHYNLAIFGTFDVYATGFEELVALDKTMFLLPIVTVLFVLIWIFRR